MCSRSRPIYGPYAAESACTATACGASSSKFNAAFKASKVQRTDHVPVSQGLFSPFSPSPSQCAHCSTTCAGCNTLGNTDCISVVFFRPFVCFVCSFVRPSVRLFACLLLYLVLLNVPTTSLEYVSNGSTQTIFTCYHT